MSLYSLARSLGLVIGWAVLGCRHSLPSVDSSPAQLVQAYFHAGKDINPSDRGEPLPVVIRIFQLGEGSTFTATRWRSLVANGKNALGRSWLAEHEVIIYPDSHTTLAFPRKPGAKHFGVVALFRRQKAGPCMELVDARSLHFHVPLDGTSLGIREEVNQP